MILSFGPFAQGPSAGALALGLPSLVALACYVAAAWPGERFSSGLRVALLAGWFAHAMAIVADITGLGREVVGARFGFAPALSMTLWLVLAVYQIEGRFLPLPGLRRGLAALGGVAVALALAFPGELIPHVASRWAPVHWVLGIASYGLFGAAVLHALMLSRAERQLRTKVLSLSEAAPAKGIPLLRLERLTYRFVAAGFVVLSLALLLGAWVANPWRWDHKTVFSMLAWVVFAALLAGRLAFGWRGPKATGWLYFGAVLLLLGYVGSRFVFEVLLHRLPPL